MDSILQFFEFNGADVVSLFARFGILVLLSFVVFFVVTFIVMQIMKAKPAEIGVSNLLKVACMYGCVFAIFSIAITIILTIRVNGLYYFDNLEWSLYCGYILLLPEIISIMFWLIAYSILQINVKQSLK